MEYFVQRGEEKFGPYTLAEMQEYAQAGRILPTDLAKSDGMTDWISVSQILGNIPVPVAAPVTVAAPVETVPLPPNLHWAVLLVIMIFGQFLGVLSLLFNWVWVMILANWARRLSGNNKAMVMVSMYPAGFVAGLLAIAYAAARHQPEFTFVGSVLIFGGLIAYVIRHLQDQGGDGGLLQFAGKYRPDPERRDDLLFQPHLPAVPYQSHSPVEEHRDPQLRVDEHQDRCLRRAHAV